MDIKFTKCHGSGNTFVMVGSHNSAFPIPQPQLSNFAQKICAKNAGACDGLLIVQQDQTHGTCAQMRMFNPDGTEALTCGNGLRCVGRYTMQALGVTSTIISTNSRTHKVQFADDLDAGICTVAVAMGSPNFAPEAVPIQSATPIINQRMPELFGRLQVSFLAMPNPHLVAIVDEISLDLLSKIGKLVNSTNCSKLSEGCNVNFVQKLDIGDFFVATFERGVGLTNSCGSGMTAASAVLCMQQLAPFDLPLSIRNRGGMVQTTVRKKGDNITVQLSGDATYMAAGVVSCDVTAKNFTYTVQENFTEEAAWAKLNFHHDKIKISA